MLRISTLVLMLLPALLGAQVTWQVQVGGSTIGGTPPFYNPQHLTIDVGDIVQWTNVSGTHNVNGSTALFPANPQGFTSGSPQSGGWTFSFTFTIPGLYNYHCTQVGHSATQFGSITVLDNTSVSESEVSETIRLHPNPAATTLFLELPSPGLHHAEVIATDGRVLERHSLQGEGKHALDIQRIPSGNNILRITCPDGGVTVHRFQKL